MREICERSPCAPQCSCLSSFLYICTSILAHVRLLAAHSTHFYVIFYFTLFSMHAHSDSAIYLNAFFAKIKSLSFYQTKHTISINNIINNYWIVFFFPLGLVAHHEFINRIRFFIVFAVKFTCDWLSGAHASDQKNDYSMLEFLPKLMCKMCAISNTTRSKWMFVCVLLSMFYKMFERSCVHYFRSLVIFYFVSISVSVSAEYDWIGECAAAAAAVSLRIFLFPFRFDCIIQQKFARA